jgi:pimeloyl-ACP methyl ester carboxylesterase
VVSFHGNAAHLASSHRPATYQQFLGTSSSERPIHVIAFDYRGFGWSTGSPTEEGVIQDSVSLLSALTGHASTSDIPHSPSSLKPSQIILVGQSLGTFVSSALYHEWTITLGRAPFRALVLFASFTSLTNLLDSYSIKGLTPPLLSPLLAYPKIQKYFLSKLVDKWDTNQRLVELVSNPGIELDLTMIHARDDWEIPWNEGRKSWERVLDAATSSAGVDIEFSRDRDLELWASVDGKKKLRWQRVSHGGHNRIPTSEHARLAIMRLLKQ